MGLLNKISIKFKLFALGGILIFFILFSTAVSVYKMGQIGDEIVAIAEQDIPLTEVVTKVTIHQLEQAVNFERALRFGVEMKEDAKALPHFKKAVNTFNEHSHIVNTAIKKGEIIAEEAMQHAHSELDAKEFKHVDSVLKNVEKEHEQYEKHAHEVIALLEKGDVHHAHELAEKTEAEEEKIDHELEALLVELEKFTKEAALQAEHDEQSALRMLIIIAIISVVIGSFIAVLIIRNLSKNIQMAVSVAETISSGDLTQEVESNSNDEMGRLLNALSMMRNNLYNMVLQMNDSSSQLAAASEELSAVSEQTNQNIHNQQSEVEQAATAINEMTATIQEVAKKCSEHI